MDLIRLACHTLVAAGFPSPLLLFSFGGRYIFSLFFFPSLSVVVRHVYVYVYCKRVFFRTGLTIPSFHRPSKDQPPVLSISSTHSTLFFFVSHFVSVFFDFFFSLFVSVLSLAYAQRRARDFRRRRCVKIKIYDRGTQQLLRRSTTAACSAGRQQSGNNNRRNKK